KLANDQLLFFLGGAGGTGKSRVIDAVSRLCSGWQNPSCLLKTALTGKAATLIQGRTLASFMLALENSKTSDFVGLDMLVIDEVLMMTKRDWLKLDRLLRLYKHVPGVRSGGVHIILVGDFLQLPPPVDADPIYLDPRDKDHLSTIDIEGFILWRRFGNVIVLTEIMRFQHDLEWGEGCTSARLSDCTPSFINLINSGLGGEGSMDWDANTVFVTPDNITRTAINNEFLKQVSAVLPPGHYPLRIVANCNNSIDTLSRHDIEYIMGLPDTRFGRMAPFVILSRVCLFKSHKMIVLLNGPLMERWEHWSRLHFRLTLVSRLSWIRMLGLRLKFHPRPPPTYAIVSIARGPNATPIDCESDTDVFPVFYDTRA
ncbi:hypothetical protein PHMEG_00021985, partial [Phytophthora megakarya]